MYLVCLFDRHTDPEFHLFKDWTNAVAKAEELSNGYDWQREEVEQGDAEWPFYRDLNNEGDHIYIEHILVED